jgi:hypothetical protein
MSTFQGSASRSVLLAVCVFALLAVTVGTARAGDEEKPAVNGKNSKIQLSGVGWFAYRYLLADEINATAPKGFLSATGVDRKDANSFDLDRVQVTGDYMFNDRVSWRTVLEGDDTGGALKLYVKNAFLRVKDPCGLKGTSVKFGLYGHGMTGTVDDFWGYRLISENGINRYLGVSSAFVGAGMDGKLAQGVVDFDLSITNEQGYNKTLVADAPNRGKYKSLMGRVILTPPGDDALMKSFHLALFGQMNGKNPISGPDTSYVSATALPKSASDNRNLWFEAFPYFKKDKLAVGFEYVMYSNKYTQQKKRTTDLEAVEIKSSYIGGVVTYQAVPSLGLFARVDLYDPNTDLDASWSGTTTAPKIKNLMTTTVIAGASHPIANGVRGILDVEYTKFEKPKHATDGSELTLDPDVTVTARMEVKL